MSKNISVSDEVYERLKREKGDRSFSEVIAERLDRGNRLADVAGAGVFGDGDYEQIEADMRELTRGTVERMDDETSR